MINCTIINNDILNSRSYIITKEDSIDAWLIDCGDVDKIFIFLNEKKKIPKGVFLTHCHYDHIYGVNSLLKNYPETLIYLSCNGGVKGVKDCRLNTSKYTPSPYIIETNNFVELNEGDEVLLYSDIVLYALKTDGHSPDSMSYKVDDILFTGDAYIPSVEIVTRLPGGDKIQAEISKSRILELIMEESLKIMPGHFFK